MLLASALLLPACAARRVSPTPEEPTTPPAVAPTPAPTVATPTGLQREVGPIGTPHPIVFQRAATDGRWVVACQAREDTNGDGALEVRFGQHGNTSGDALTPYLFLEPGAGEPLDDFLTADPTDRYLVVARGGSLRLLDTYTHTDTELAPLEAIPDSNTPGSPLPVSFSSDGKRLLLVTLTGQDKRATAFLINLENGSRQEVPHGPGVLGYAELDPEGRWAVLGVVTQDSDGDGQLSWPRTRTSLSARFCRGPIMSYGRYGREGDSPTWLLSHVDGGELAPIQGLLQVLGDSVLRQGEQGEVFVEQVSGQRTEWVPASCRANVLYVDAAREQVLVACTAQGEALELHGARIHQPLGLSAERSRRIPFAGTPPRLIPVTPASTAGGESSSQSVVDLETRTVHPVGGQVKYTQETRVLVARNAGADDKDRRLWLVDIASGEQRELGTPTEYGLELAGNLIYVDGLLVDMSTGQLVGPVKGEVQALDTQGRVLPDHIGQGRAPLGPLQWTPVVRPQ
ncbi:hypothetical protein [Archangium lansingense]|uniref:Lipoprotein n=1 Tax=Archangium lansingense TaxID=2995310 RepID=A0ABT3ZUM3_9BACT|nr:hypothetical protein [Archangium lansinium]MCY1073090.1 hypothetical protein [Archangium lansinium]